MIRQRDEVQDPNADLTALGNKVNNLSQPPSVPPPSSNAPIDPAQTPRERVPQQAPAPNSPATPRQPEQPSPISMHEPHQAFAGGGSTTMTPPSMTAPTPMPMQPFQPMAGPSPSALASSPSVLGNGPAGGGRLFGGAEGQLGGGFGLPDSGMQQNEPSSLLLSLLHSLKG